MQSELGGRIQGALHYLLDDDKHETLTVQQWHCMRIFRQKKRVVSGIGSTRRHLCSKCNPVFRKAILREMRLTAGGSERLMQTILYFAALHLLITLALCTGIKGRHRTDKVFAVISMRVEVSFFDIFAGVYMKLKLCVTPGSYLGPSSKFLRYFAQLCGFMAKKKKKSLKGKTDSVPLFPAKRISSCETLIMLLTWSKHMPHLLKCLSPSKDEFWRYLWKSHWMKLNE